MNIAKRIIFCFLTLLSSVVIASEVPEYQACNAWVRWFRPACNQVSQIFHEGHTDLIVTGYAWHNRSTYSPEKIKTYNERAWGGGLGRSIMDENGNWQSMYAMAFLDSHKNVEPMAGYGYVKTKEFANMFRLGIGLTVFMTVRPDIFNGIPFPGALPLATIGIKRFTLAATYIPGSFGAGNVLFVFGRYSLE